MSSAPDRDDLRDHAERLRGLCGSWRHRALLRTYALDTRASHLEDGGAVAASV